MKSVRWVLMIGLVAMFATAAAAQTGGIKVRVTDEDGLPLPAATVTIESDRGLVATSTDLTNKKGVVDFPILKPGSGYSIKVEFPGYSSVLETELRFSISKSLPIDVQMIAALEERVRVVATRQVIDLESSEQSTRFSDDFISDLPVAGRQYQNILTLAPGVQDPDGDGNPTVHGSRSRDFQTTVGGISNVDPLTGQFLSRINPNSIEEMEVITAGAGVEFGRAQGGFAQIIQKQGSNQHEGVVEFYLSTSKLDKDGAGFDSNLPLADFESIQPLFQVSGPILKDKLWYRFSHEFTDREEPINVVTGIEIENRKEHSHSDQITWQASPRNKLAFNYQSDPFDGSNLGVSSTVPASASLGIKRRGETLSLAWDAPYSPKLFVRSTVGWTDQENERFPSVRGSLNECVAPSAGFLAGASCFDRESGLNSGSFNQTRLDHRQRLTLKSQATIFGGNFWGMDHQFKLGLSVENERFFRSQNTGPSVFYIVVDTPQGDPTDPDAENSFESEGFAFVNVAIPRNDDVRATGTNWGVYAEDQFKPMQNMTVTLGVRVDREEINSEGRQQMNPAAELAAFFADPEINSTGGAGRVANRTFTGYEGRQDFVRELQRLLCAGAQDVGNCEIMIPNRLGAQSVANVRRNESIDLANTNFSPKLSWAYSPWDNGKTAFKVSLGRNFNLIPLNVPLIELEPATSTLVYKVDLGTGAPTIDESLNPRVDIQTVSRNLKTPYQDEILLSVERELWAETSMTLSYINRKFKNQIQDINTNLDTGDFGRCQVQSNSAARPVVASPGVGSLVIDPWTNETYIDTKLGDGDGRIDDCVGESEPVRTPGSEGADGEKYFVQRGDGLADLYTLNPLWGDIFEVGNHNSADYNAYVFELTRRQYRNWEMQASYTWSEAKGDGEDFFQAIGDDPSLRGNVRGYQSNDQRHVVKFNATTITPWGIRMGSAVTWQSGLPYSILVESFSFDTLPPALVDFSPTNGARPRQQYLDESGILERNSARNESYWNVDLKATKELTLSKGLNLQLSAEVFNVLNDGTYIVYNPLREAGQQINGNAEALRRFGRRWQVGMKLAF